MRRKPGVQISIYTDVIYPDTEDKLAEFISGRFYYNQNEILSS